MEIKIKQYQIDQITEMFKKHVPKIPVDKYIVQGFVEGCISTYFSDLDKKKEERSNET